MKMTPEESAESILFRYSATGPFTVEEMHRVLSVNCGHVLTLEDTQKILGKLEGPKAVRVAGGYVAGPQARQR